MPPKEPTTAKTATTRRKPAAAKTPKTQPARKPSSTKRAGTATPDHRYLSGNALVCVDNIDVLKGVVRQQLKDVWRWTVDTQNSYQVKFGPSLLKRELV